jgi:hypothetical protein
MGPVDGSHAAFTELLHDPGVGPRRFQDHSYFSITILRVATKSPATSR